MAAQIASPGALLLTPGAGADRNQHTLVALEEAVAPLPVPAGRFPVPIAGQASAGQAAGGHRAPGDRRRPSWSPMPGSSRSNWCLGGRSYGGRMCSMAVAQGLPAAGLILLSYPLHPPGKPENLRVEHFPATSGAGSADLRRQGPVRLPGGVRRPPRRDPGPVTQVWLTGGHDPRAIGAITSAVADWLATLRTAQPPEISPSATKQ